MPREIASVDSLFNDKIDNMAQNATTKDSTVDAFGNHKVVLDDIVEDETPHTLTDDELGDLFDMASADASGLGDAEEIVTAPKDKSTPRSRRHKEEQIRSRRKKEDEPEEKPTPIPAPAKKTVVEDFDPLPTRTEPELDEVELPDWADSIRRKVNASVAHAFLLNGNVRDYMVRNVSIEDGMVLVLDPAHENFDVIARYDQARGISFYGADLLADDGRRLSKVYEERFLEEMQESQKRMSMKVSDTIPNQDAVTLFTVLSDMFNHASKTRQAKILLFVDYSDLLVPDASSAQMRPDERKLAITLSDIGRSQMADEAGNVMIFVTDDMSQLSSRIRSSESRIEQVLIPIPDREERMDFIDNVLDIPENTLSDGTQIFKHPESIDKTTFAINSAGLSRKQIEDILLRALSDDEPLTLKTMKDRKNEIIREDYDDVLEIIEPKFGYDAVGGSEQIKRLFMDEIVNPVQAGETEACPMGVLIPGPPGVGKSVPADTLIPTPGGFVEIKDIKVGDLVFNRQGKPVKVLGVYPQEKPLDVYEVHLRNGVVIECSGNHLWSVYTTNNKENLHVKETSELAEECLAYENYGTHKYYMPVADCVEYSEKEYRIPPYVMGCLLGDGCTAPTSNSALTMACAPEDRAIIDRIADMIGAVEVIQGHKNNCVWRFKMSAKEKEEYLLRNEGKLSKKSLSRTSRFRTADYLRGYEKEVMCKCGEKSIPEEYKFGSREQRLELIRGLMDTDGNINVTKTSRRKNITYRPVFATTSKKLCDDFCEVVASLGFITSVVSHTYENVPYTNGRTDKIYYANNTAYHVSIECSDLDKHLFYWLPRKKKIAEEAAKEYEKKGRHKQYRYLPIVDVVKTEQKKDMVCLRVDDKDHLFLIGKEYIPTHNTMICKATAYEAKMNFVALNLNRLMDKWLGATERNLDRALQCAVAMAPTVIFIDEIDEALPNRNDPNASSVNKRINQRLLTFFSDTTHRGQVIIISATNYPGKIDPAFKRAGRFDVRIPMFAPDEFDRMRIMRVVAKNRGYTFSWFEDPDEKIANPFTRLKEWIAAGNSPESNPRVFTGDLDSYNYKTNGSLGKEVNHEVYLPKKLISVIGKKQITLQQFYEAARVLFMDMPERKPDSSSGEIISDEELYKLMQSYLMGRTDVLGDDPKVAKSVMKRLWRWETIYKPFADQTFRMTGAELDVVMSKAITLYKRWLRETDPKLVQKNIAAGVIKGDHDIPWKPFLLHACYSTVNAVAGIKSMEDDALLNTSDLDYIPDALYAESDDGRLVSYHERQEELIAKQTKSLMG